MSARQLHAADPDSDGGNDAFPASGNGSGAAGRVRAVPGRTVFFGLLVLAILAGAAWALLGSSLLVVRHVEVTGNRLVTAVQVRQAARIAAGAPLATVNTATAARRVEQLAPVLFATVRRSWPDTIVISVRERTPVLAVAAAGEYQLIDSHGVTVRQAARRPASMPLLSAPPAVLRGSPAVSAAAGVLGQLPRSLRSRLTSVSATSASSVTLHLTGHITVLWGGAVDPAQKLAELGMLLRKHARYYNISDPNTAVTAG
ncbi:MAG TPA: FtsQ-type POTRA domain-containing protein [Streptosporangiaceae bacterium]|nr:FtsQ-type POTRA domain-containing protein [Streptosporangiaceae bacterium]